MSCDSLILPWKDLCNLIALLWFEFTIEDRVSFTKKSLVIINVNSLEYMYIYRTQTLYVFYNYQIFACVSLERLFFKEFVYCP